MKDMKRHIKSTKALFVLCFIFVVGAINAQMTLDEALTKAAENNPALQAKFNAYYASLEKVDQVGTLPDPKLNFSTYILPVQTRVGPKVFDISLAQSFPWFGTLAAKKDQASQQAEVKFQMFQMEKTNLFYDVKALYYKIYTIDRLIEIKNDFLENLSKQEEIILSKIEAGEASLVDELRIQMEHKEVKAELENMGNKRAILSSKMNTLLNNQVEENVEVENHLPLITLSESETNVVGSIPSNTPSIMILNEKMKAIELKKEVIYNSGKPSFTAGIGYSAVNERTDMAVINNGQDIIMPMVSIKFPIYRKKYDAGIRELGFQITETSFEIEQAKNEHCSMIVEAVNKYDQANRNVTLYKELLVQSNQAMEILQSSYSSGDTGYVEVLRMQRMILTYEMKLENAKLDQNTSVAMLEKMMAEGL